MDDLTRDSWDVMSRLAHAAKALTKAQRKAQEAKEEELRINQEMQADLDIIYGRMSAAGVESVFYGDASSPFVVADPANDGVLRPANPFDLDREYELATGIRPGKKPEADPLDMVDLTQPAHEAVTAPSNN